MNTYILIYDGFISYETIFAGMFMKSKGEVITVSYDYNTISSLEGFKYTPDKLLSNINTDSVDLFLIPGGNSEPLFENKDLYRILRDLNNKKRVIGAICDGPMHLAKAGILNNKNYTSSISKEGNELFKSSIFIDKDVVVDGNIITAKSNAYLDFAFEIGKIFDVFESEAELQETMNFYRNAKPAIVNI